MRPLLTISATILLATFCQGAPFSRKVFEKVSEVAENAEDMLNVKVKVATTSLDAVVEAFRFHLKDPVGAMQQAKEVFNEEVTESVDELQEALNSLLAQFLLAKEKMSEVVVSGEAAADFRESIEATIEKAKEAVAVAADYRGVTELVKKAFYGTDEESLEAKTQLEVILEEDAEEAKEEIEEEARLEAESEETVRQDVKGLEAAVQKAVDVAEEEAKDEFKAVEKTEETLEEAFRKVKEDLAALLEEAAASRAEKLELGSNFDEATNEAVV